jgi:hypothetical protein
MTIEEKNIIKYKLKEKYEKIFIILKALKKVDSRISEK